MTSEHAQPPAVPEATAPPARWRLERVSDNRIDLLVTAGPGIEPCRYPMSAGELHRLVHQGDRLLSWSVPSAEGTFTQPADIPCPEEVRQSLAINGYVVVSDTVESHTRLVQETPWASWVEEVPAGAAGQVAWFVNVFAVDDPQFRQAAQQRGVTISPAGGVRGDDAR